MNEPTIPSLPPFPVDDLTLDAVEHALAGCWTFAEGAQNPHLIGAEYTLDQLLDFLSGYDPTKVDVLEEGLFDGDPPRVTMYVGGCIYHPHDVIGALIAEIRRLRGIS